MLARRVLESATSVIFPSPFLLEKHRELFALSDLEGTIIEPAPAHRPINIARERRAVAYAGSVKRHKGGQLLPQIAATLATRGVALHVFGGGDVALLRELHRAPNVILHGYYRTGTLPKLLTRHAIGLVVLPSIVPESYGLTLTEAWLAGATAAAFDLGALADRIRATGGGTLAPLDSGAAGLAHLIETWLTGNAQTNAPQVMTSARDAAREHVELYRRVLW
jgi:glycosyltransferase involved in cell wall biosynthesis